MLTFDRDRDRDQDRDIAQSPNPRPRTNGSRDTHTITPPKVSLKTQIRVKNDWPYPSRIEGEKNDVHTSFSLLIAHFLDSIDSQPFKMVRSPPIWRQEGIPAGYDWSRVQRAPRKPQQGPQPLLLKPEPMDWQKRPDFTIRMRTVHPKTSTYDLYQNFKQFGQIVLIEIFQDRSGGRDGGAKIKFAPPPAKAFWKKPYHLIINQDGREEYDVHVFEDQSSNRKSYDVQSPIRKQIWYQPQMKLFVSALHFGIIVAPNSVMPMHTARPIKRSDGAMPRNDLTFVVDLLRRRIETTFFVTFEDPRSQGIADYPSMSPVGQFDRINKFKFELPFDQLQKIQRVKLEDGGFALIIALHSPPAFFRKRDDEKSCHSEETCVWSEFDTWFRQTDVTYDPYSLPRAVVTLHKERPVIDLGMFSTSPK